MTNQPHTDENYQYNSNMSQSAESQLTRSGNIDNDLDVKSPEEIIRELRAHQIELKLQNEELKKANLDLELIRDEYINIYEFSPLGFISLNSEAVITKLNLTGAMMVGSVRQQVINTRFRKYVLYKDHDKWDQFFITLLHKREHLNCTIRLQRPDGTLIFCWIEGISVESADGLIQIRLTIGDISLQQEAILKSNLNTRRILSLLRLYQYSFANDSEFLEYVLEASLMSVSSKIGFIGLINDNEKTMDVHAWSKEAMASYAVQAAPLHFSVEKAGIWADSIRNKCPVIFNDYETLRPDGKNLPQGHIPLTRVISIPVIRDAKVVAVIVGANKDIPYNEDDENALMTLAHSAWELFFHRKYEQNIKINEKRLRIAQHMAGFGNLSYDINANTLVISDELCRILGIEHSVWKGVLEEFILFIHPDDRDMVQKVFTDLIESGGRNELEHRIVRPDGTVRWVHSIKERIDNQYVNQTVIEGILHDITERKQSKEDMIQAFVQISKNAETLAILNDEIRNPLTVISMVVDMEESKYKEIIFKAIKDIDLIIDRLDQRWLTSLKIRSYLKQHHGF